MTNEQLYTLEWVRHIRTRFVIRISLTEVSHYLKNS